MKAKTKILGLDLSTSSIGYCLLDLKDHSVVAIGSVDVSLEETNLSKSQLLEAELNRFIYNWLDVEVGIEKPLLGFKNGFSQMLTVGKLNQLTGFISARLYDKTKVEPQQVPANTARSLLGIKAKAGEMKAATIAYATSKGINFETRVVSRGKNKGKIVYVDGVDDAADAFVIASYLQNIIGGSK